MANILQVQNTGLNNQQIGAPGVHPRVEPNPQIVTPGRVDPSPAGDNGGQISPEAGQANVNFESNYTNFVQRMHEGMQLTEDMVQLLFTDGAALQSMGDSEIQELMNQLFQEIELQDPKELMDFIESQQQAQVKFSGELFDGLRNILHQEISQPFRDVILDFIKTYNNYASSEHLLNQMESLGDDIESLLLPSSREDFEKLMEQLDKDAAPGNTEKNAEVINKEIIPFLSKYVAKTHNYGPVRTASVLFSLYAVKYEDGNENQLKQLFAKMVKNNDFRMLFKGDPEEALQKAIENLKPQSEKATNFPQMLTKLIQKGTEGSAGAENVDKYYQVLNHLLMNESVYMPLLHMLIPFRYQDKNVMSEMWVDPDAERDDPDAAKKQKIFIKFSIQNVGNFELISMINNGSVNMHLFVPPTLNETPDNISKNVQDILKKNGLNVKNMELGVLTRSHRVDEVFPEIKDKEKGINVAV
ncbi:hypothetical protein [Oribacterium sp. WCC10]|uniref:hypothetical protein n=1 Tax=Oribacterium sp. WCC10 TaxID=1855343 RepID=UPI0008EDADA7|nr:hypothetical protein [Oribacterium sp. WCC10]SFG24474.1 hypothetical protein SAMN05216356_10440 [Oribacterium sp. WCC10]